YTTAQDANAENLSTGESLLVEDIAGAARCSDPPSVSAFLAARFCASSSLESESRRCDEP
ncbi:MAG TPA: hypothetical protein PLD23_18805, partial [Armatimonadota bacterium]|nr:hypothetical protein [Armatimonadota bacterium]